MKLSNKAIKEIAENLDCGLICYIHKETKEIKPILDPNNIYADEEIWKENLDEIENNWDEYLKIDKMSSREAFQIMEEFTEQISDKNIRNRLIYALNKNKPFKNFRYEVDYNEEIRPQWFKYKAYKYEEWVKMYLEHMIDEADNNIEI